MKWIRDSDLTCLNIRLPFSAHKAKHGKGLTGSTAKRGNPQLWGKSDWRSLVFYLPQRVLLLFWNNANLSIILRATRGACNRNLQVVITHASYVCSQHSFGPPLRMFSNGMHKTHFGSSITRNLITPVLTFYHVKHTQSTALVQKRFDVRSLSPALRNLWLLLDITTFGSKLPLTYLGSSCPF